MFDATRMGTSSILSLLLVLLFATIYHEATLLVVSFSPSLTSHVQMLTASRSSRMSSCVGSSSVYVSNTGQRMQKSDMQLRAEASSSSSSSTKTTLDEQTTWNLRMVLQNLPTTQGSKVDRIITLRVKFIEEVGYEPPQGQVMQVFMGNDDDSSTAKIISSRWQLSEDPNERKDSLWIWGLFSEPLYPFLLLRLEFDEILLPGSLSRSTSNRESGSDSDITTASTPDAIAPFTLFAQIDHRREDGQVVLSSGADLTIKQKETIKADPFGAATVDVFDDVKVGKLQIQAITK